MPTLPRSDADSVGTISARIRADIWEAARAEAFHGKVSIASVLDRVLRAHFGLSVDGGGASEDATAAAAAGPGPAA